MSTLQIILAVYLVTVVIWAIFVPIRMSRTKPNSKLEKIFFLITIPFAPICWIVGLVMLIAGKTKAIRVAKEGERPRPLPKNLRGKLKKDVVLFNNRTMSIAEVNRITGKEYTLEQIYGKKYVASLTDEDRQQFDDGTSRLHIDDSVRKDDPDYPAIERFARARMSGKLEDVRDLFVPDVILTLYGNKILHGVDAVLDYWQDRYERLKNDRIKTDLRITPCMLYNGIALEERPERYAQMITTFSFKVGKISWLFFGPEYLNPEYQYFGGFREAPYTEEYFSNYFTGSLEPEPLKIPCPCCGKPSEDLKWYSFEYPEAGLHYGYRGKVSVCPHCHRTVEVYPEERFEKTDKQRNSYKADEPKQKAYMPGVKCGSFYYGTPLKGTDYVSGLDDEKMYELDFHISIPEGVPHTARKVAEDFNHIFISHFAQADKSVFDKIVDCYRRAFVEDGNIEAGNNLAIIYMNYADRMDDGIAALEACAMRGCPNAVANYFSARWTMDGMIDKTEAVSFALSSAVKPAPLCWNLAVLYLCGQAVAGSSLSTDKEKARKYLGMIVDGSAPRCDDDEHYTPLADELLQRVDEFDAMTGIAKDYINFTVNNVSHSAERHPGFDISFDLFYHGLPHMSIPEGSALHLSLASSEHDGHGDISYFVFKSGDGTETEPYANAEEILKNFTVERSIYGAWEAYLFSKTRNLYPTYWHGGYNRETLIFSERDLAAVPALKGRALEIIMNGDDLKPRVFFEGATAFVECCYWSEWGGLYREMVKIVFEDNRVILFDHAMRKNLYMYDCGIMF